ncbi:hypothetical protein [Flagellimonas sp.]|uniref:hypothetical protein n=1 Tax=Flagellimonas sp. TaxID=2058762 RepID=UPI003B58BAB1
MRIFLKILTLLTILASFYLLVPAFAAFKSITTDPEGWMGGVSAETTMVWFAIIILGFGFLGFTSFLALMGWLFGNTKRIAAFWLFKLPGILGIVLSSFLALALYLWSIDWGRHIFVIALLIIPFIIYTLFGNHIRKSNPKKLQKDGL